MGLAEEKKQNGSAKKILVVDDDAQVQFLVKSLLEGEGFAVSVASNGKECLDILGKECPDLILLDVRMPKVDGIQTIRNIKNNEELSSIPIIVVSSMGDTDTVTKAVDMGVHDFIVKPFDLELLKYKIAEQLYSVSFESLMEVIRRLTPGHATPNIAGGGFELLMKSWQLYRIDVSEIEMAILLDKSIEFKSILQLKREAARKHIKVFFQNGQKWESIWPFRENRTNELIKTKIRIDKLEQAIGLATPPKKK